MPYGGDDDDDVQGVPLGGAPQQAGCNPCLRPGDSNRCGRGVCVSRPAAGPRRGAGLRAHASPCSHALYTCGSQVPDVRVEGLRIMTPDCSSGPRALLRAHAVPGLRKIPGRVRFRQLLRTERGLLQRMGTSPRCVQVSCSSSVGIMLARVWSGDAAATALAKMSGLVGKS